MRRTLLAVLPALLLAPALASAEAAAPAAAEKAVLAAHDARLALTVKGDVDGLAAMMTDDLTYTHSSAVTETKAEFLAGLKSGKYLYKEIAPRDRRVRVHGDSAIVSGSAHIVIEPGGQRTEIELYFTELYVKQGGRWKMALWQSTKLPAPAAPATAK
ncbi:MAG: nuclear transport factor 2 family protein [Vicinamibacteria bacterium]